MSNHFAWRARAYKLYAVPGVIGCLQALEAVKVIAGKGNPLSGRLLLFSAMDGQVGCFWSPSEKAKKG